MMPSSYTGSVNDDIVEKILERLERHNDYSAISDEKIFSAEGVNIDYLVTLKKINNNIHIEGFTINNQFDDIYLNIIKLIKSEEKIPTYTLYELIKNSQLIPFSKEQSKNSKNGNFNYCIEYSNRYLPDVPIDISFKLDSLHSKLKSIDTLYTSGEYKKILTKDIVNENLTEQEIENIVIQAYDENIKNVNKDFAKYIVIWLHAFRITSAIRECKKQHEIITYSHQYKGWSVPDYQLTANLKLSFKTNFGYGNSSHFYLLLNFKGVQIFPFMDWCNYEYAQASEMIQYSALIHRKKTKSTNKEIVIDDSSWFKAMDFALKAGNLSLEDEDLFIKTYIVDPIENLIVYLENFIHITDEELNSQYKDFDYGFDIKEFDNDLVERIKRVKLMDVKGAKISGTLDFITQFKILANTIDKTDLYIKKIIELNFKIKPILESSFEEADLLSIDMKKRTDEIYKALVLVYQGSDNKIGLNLMEENKKILTEYEFKEKYSNYDEIKKIYDSLIKSKSKFEENYRNSQKLMNKINSYIKKMEIYFSNTV